MGSSFFDFGIRDLESYLGYSLAVKLLKEELFELNKVRAGIGSIIVELQKNSFTNQDERGMFQTIIRIGVYELIKTLSLYRATSHTSSSR
tara:strand:- start:21 stop:290 length:270 start_codon:yes stop_codon:yes gene_type:complete